MHKITPSLVHSLQNAFVLGAAIFTFSLVTTPFASATQEISTLIPNLPDSCNTCHVAGGGSPRNDFGIDVFDNLGAADLWAEIYSLDSDGDGQTNGQELGDPEGIWTVGATPARDCDLSHPGVATDTSAAPDATDCGGAPDAGPVADAGPVSTGDAPACSCASLAQNAPWTLLGVFALVPFLRRRR